MSESVTGRYQRRIYLLRHADVTYFDDRGQPLPPNEVPLNEEGIAQAKATADLLKDIPFDRAVTSDLPRTIQTAETVLSGSIASPTIEPTPSLREIQPGRLADVPTEEVEKAFLTAFGASLNRESRFLGGETYGDFVDRVIPCFEELLGGDWKHLLIVAHGGVNRLILLKAFEAGFSGLDALEQDPACLNLIDVASNGHLLVRLMNHTPYNPIKKGLSLTTMERLYLQYQGRSD